MNKRDHGAQLELFARGELENQGCKIIETNYLCKLGEIDIIAQDKNCLIFVEVRYRKQNAYGGAGASVDRKKQQKLIRAASLYLQKKNITNKARCRFDVFAIQGNSGRLTYNWIKDAFTA